MFAEFNYDLYEKDSIVKIKMNNSIQDDNDFNSFLESWLQLYYLEKDFIFIFDTSNVGYIPIKYSLKMSAFIKNLKRRDYQYLQKSIILVNNNIVKRMLDLIFYIQPPVAPVYIINNETHIELILKNEIPENIITIFPGKSFLNLF